MEQKIYIQSQEGDPTKIDGSGYLRDERLLNTPRPVQRLGENDEFILVGKK